MTTELHLKRSGLATCRSVRLAKAASACESERSTSGQAVARCILTARECGGVLFALIDSSHPRLLLGAQGTTLTRWAPALLTPTTALAR